MRSRTLTAALVLALGLVGGVAVRAQKEARPPRPSFRPVDSPPRTVVNPAAPNELLPPAVEGVVESPAAIAPAADDPMQDVDAFVEQNRRKANDSIDRLTKEAESLRARLRKVEMALERWKLLAGALEQPRRGAVESVTGAVSVPPTDLSAPPLEKAPAVVPPPSEPTLPPPSPK